MKGNSKLLSALNSLLADELTAVNQYMVHSEMCSNWGFEKLHKHFEKRAVDEMKHAEKLIGRILFLEGLPVVSKLNKLAIGDAVDVQLNNDHKAEEEAVKSYNKAIVLAQEVNDYATQDFLQEVLNDEDKHLDNIEGLLDQIRQMTLPVFLSTQV